MRDEPLKYLTLKTTGSQVVRRLEVREAHLHILKHWPEGQASNLTQTSRKQPEHSPGSETGVCHALLLLCSTAPVISLILVPQFFAGAAKGMPLDYLVLKVGRLVFLGQELGADYNPSQRPNWTGSVFTLTLCHALEH